ncbi:MAG TPA: ABC transporter permease [Vicinamibacterales bacterium]|nr:ABC transporter permease [Vicinamibacterales bacterium]
MSAIANAITELARDMRFAVRSLMRAKGLAATVIVTLGLGIGANAAIFSIVRGVLLRPLVNRNEERLIYVRQTAPGVGIENYTFSVPEVNDFKDRATSFVPWRDAGDNGPDLVFSFRAEGYTPADGEDAPRARVRFVSSGFFSVLGVRLVAGREFTDADRRGAGPVAIVS